LSELEWLLFK